MERRATNLEELMITNFPEHDDVQWKKTHDSVMSSSRVLDGDSSTSSFSSSGDDRQ